MAPSGPTYSRRSTAVVARVAAALLMLAAAAAAAGEGPVLRRALARARAGEPVGTWRRNGSDFEARDDRKWRVGGNGEAWRGYGFDTDTRGDGMSDRVVGGSRADIDRGDIDGGDIDVGDIDGGDIDGCDIDGSDIDGGDTDRGDIDGGDIGGGDTEGRDSDGGDGESEGLGGDDVGGWLSGPHSQQHARGGDEGGTRGRSPRGAQRELQGERTREGRREASRGRELTEERGGSVGGEARGCSVGGEARRRGEGRRGTGGRRRLADGQGSEGGGGSDGGGGSEGGGGRYDDGSDGRERMHVGARGGMAGPGVWVDGVKRHTRRAGDRCWSKWEMRMYVTVRCTCMSRAPTASSPITGVEAAPVSLVSPFPPRLFSSSSCPLAFSNAPRPSAWPLPPTLSLRAPQRPDRQLPPSLALRRRLSEYRRMHRRCTQIHDWLAFYRNPYMGWKDGVDGLGNCKYLFFMPPAYHGMGNRIMALISAFAYALLTNRTLIIPPDSFLFRFFCDPFPGTSWTIPLDAYNTISQTVHRSLARNRGLVNGWDGHDVSMHMSWDSKADTWGMFCEAEQQEMATARFATLYTDYFLVPHFYLVPSLQVQLESLFPDRRVFTHLSRYLLHPANYLWDRITRLYHGHLALHSLTVGLQIRAFEETEEDLMVNVFECATNIARVLPPVMPTDQWRHTAASVTEEALLGVRGRSIGALVVSLNPTHGTKLRDRYMLGKPLDGSTVSVFSVSGEGQEKQEDQLQYELAVTEMWLLAFCDVLLVTDTSTFGYVAAGVAGVTPYTMNVAKWKHSDWRSNGRLACMLGSSEPCYVHPVQERVLCPGEAEKRPLENIPQTRACHATGVGLTTNLPPLPLPSHHDALDAAHPALPRIMPEKSLTGRRFFSPRKTATTSNQSTW
ncbi:unnamed protein product [Closterium sp. NIES-65]|nr:unnamed protein product [Closterium sp. NIES-65]